MLAVFSAPALPAATAGVPRTGRRVQSNSTILACAVEIGQTKVDSNAFPVFPRVPLWYMFLGRRVCFVVSCLLCENSAVLRRNPSMKRLLTVSLCLLVLTLSGFAQAKKSPMKKASGPAPDKASLQKIWDGWSTLDPANVAKYYAPGP